MPKEYIERGALIDEVESTQWYHISHQKNLVQGAACEADALYKATDIYSVIKSAPTADVVEVTRCKDCYYCEIAFDGEKYCELHSDGWGDDLHYVDDDGYCSCGVRKDK